MKIFKNLFILTLLTAAQVSMADVIDYMTLFGPWKYSNNVRTLSDGIYNDKVTKTLLFTKPTTKAIYVRNVDNFGMTRIPDALSGKQFVFKATSSNGAKIRLLFKAAGWVTTYATPYLSNNESHTFTLPKERYIVIEALSGIGNNSFIKTSLTENPVITDSIFAPTSFWYQAIPANVTLHANSENFKVEFLRQKAAHYKTVATNIYNYASPVYIAGPNEATTAVGFNNCQNKTHQDKSLIQQLSAVPIPAHATQASGTDGEMTIYQPSTDTIWELWKAVKDPVTGSWIACWGGKMSNASKSDGVFPKYYGTTATSLPFLGGQVTAEELERGEIKHAIGIALVDLEHFTIFSYPAHRSDGYNINKVKNRIPEGLRFRFDPSINVDALPVSKAAKTIAKAGQKYGFVVWDHAGAISIRLQAPASYTSRGLADPYPVVLDKQPGYAVLKNLPWDKIQFLPFNYGKPVP